jgi:hypothetical protein
MKTPDVARGAREAATVVSDPCAGFYIANGGYSWAQTAPALASISPPDTGLYRRNARVGKAVSGRCFAFWNAVLSAEAQGTCH